MSPTPEAPGQSPRDPVQCLQYVLLQAAVATWEGSLVPLPWRPVRGLGMLGKAGPPGLGAGLHRFATQPGAPLLCPLP